MSWTIYCLSRAMSPLSQMEGVVGNKAVLRRMEVMTRLGKRAIPVITGNSIRHQLREAGGRWLIEVMGASGQLTQPEVYYMISGGSGFVGRGGRESPAGTRAMRELSPHMSVLGGTTPQDIIGGRLRADFGWLVCEEFSALLPHYLPDGCDVGGMAFRPAEAFIGEQQYTRHAATDAIGDLYDADADAQVRAQRHAGYDGKDRPEDSRDMWIAGEDRDKSPQMIYSGECINPGAVLAHRLRVGHDERLELGAILWALRLWQADGGIVGGMAAKGHGLLQTNILIDPAPVGDPVADYITHAEKNADRLGEWIRQQFRPKAPDLFGGDEPKAAVAKKRKATA